MNRRTLASALSALLVGLSCHAAQSTLSQQNEQMLQQIQQQRGLTPQQMDQLRAIFARSGFMGQGNPAISVHPVTEDGCQKKLQQQHVSYANPQFEKICRAKYMAPLYDPNKDHRGPSQGLYRSIRISGYALYLPRGLGEGTRSGASVRGRGKANMRCARMGRRLRR
jgi:hypothetical protein